MDNKGLTLSGAFGLPPRAHEDDVTRALRAATAVREQLGALGLPCSVGVATGRAFCGLFGNDLRREYLLHGDVANLAARLAYAGDGEILCDEVTARAVGEHFEFEELPPIPVKGRAEPVPIRRLTAVRAAVAPRHSGLVDRESERALIAQRIEAARRRRRARRDRRRGRRRDRQVGARRGGGADGRTGGLRVLTAAADAVERATGYYAWRPVFADVLGLDGETPDPARLQRIVLEHVGGAPEIERLTPLLSSVLPIADPRQPGDRRDERRRARRQHDDAAHADPLALSPPSAPVLLIVEDCHWLDSNSLGLLTESSRRSPGCHARPDAAARARGSRCWSRSPPTEPLHLASLAAEHTAMLVRQRLGVRGRPGRAQPLRRRPRRRPPVLLRGARQGDAGARRRANRDGATVVGDLEALDVPSTVEGAVLSLVDRLTPAAAAVAEGRGRRGPLVLDPRRREAHPVRQRAPRRARRPAGARGARPDRCRQRRGRPVLRVPPRHHALGRLCAADRVPAPAAASRVSPTGTSQPHSRTSSNPTTRCSPTTGPRRTIPPRRSPTSRSAGRAGAAQRRVPRGHPLLRPARRARAQPEADPARRALWAKGEAHRAVLPGRLRSQPRAAGASGVPARSAGPEGQASAGAQPADGGRLAGRPSGACPAASAIAAAPRRPPSTRRSSATGSSARSATSTASRRPSWSTWSSRRSTSARRPGRRRRWRPRWPTSPAWPA